MSLSVIRNPDRGVWDAFVSSTLQGSIYQSYEWGQLLAGQGWEPIYLGVTDDEGLVGAALVLSRRLPRGLACILYSPRGPVLSRPSVDVLATLTRTVGKIAKERRGVFWRIDPPVLADDLGGCALFEQDGFRPVLQEWSYWNRPKYDMHLDLAPGEAALFDALPKEGRKNIRSAGRKVTIRSGLSDEDIAAFHELLRCTAAKKRILIRDVDYFVRCRNLLGPAGMMRLFVARHEGRPVCGGITTRFGRKAVQLHIANDYSLPKVGWAVQWEMIRWAIAEGCDMYDLGGTATSYPPRESDRGHGVYLFKRSLGAKIVRWYGYADQVFRPHPYRCFRAIERSLPVSERLLTYRPRGIIGRLRGLNPLRHLGHRP